MKGTMRFQGIIFHYVKCKKTDAKHHVADRN